MLPTGSATMGYLESSRGALNKPVYETKPAQKSRSKQDVEYAR